MTLRFLDTTGLEVPQPLLKLALLAADLEPGDQIEMIADYPGFETDLATWCRRLGKSLLSIEVEGAYRRRCRIRF